MDASNAKSDFAYTKLLARRLEDEYFKLGGIDGFCAKFGYDEDLVRRVIQDMMLDPDTEFGELFMEFFGH